MDDLISRTAAIEEIKPIRYCGDFISALIHLPAVDAVPVAWIMKWSNKRYRETQRDVSIVDVLEAWQKEQEAR